MNSVRSFDAPDELVEFGGILEQLVTIGGLTVSRSVTPPGWRWRDHFKPLVGGEWCQANHVGIVLSGRQVILLDDGTEYQIGSGDLFHVRPGHDSWTIGDEDCVVLEWSGQRQWTGSGGHRVLTTLLFTDIVDSTGTAAQLGDAAWHDMLAIHFHASADTIAGFGGRQVTTTGDGVLAVFDATVNGVRCAVELQSVAARQGIALRAGVHVGEVERSGENILGISVHEAARIMAEAGPGEVLVSETVALLCRGGDLTFEEAGDHKLKGVPDRLHLYRVNP